MVNQGYKFIINIYYAYANIDGYVTYIEKSRHKNSKAKRIIVENNSPVKNITVVQVSPGSKRHGETAYVKVSTSNAGIMKIISDVTKYKTDGNFVSEYIDFYLHKLYNGYS